MSRFTVMRTNMALPDECGLAGARVLLFGCLDGFGKDDKSAWRRLWKRLIELEPGEMVEVQTVFPRSGRFHRRHMAIEQAVFDAQERFADFEQFRYWLKVGSAWVTWAAGPKGGVVPIPKSISYAAADQHEFQQYHEAVIGFLRGPHAAPYLWSHLGDRAHEQIDAILEGFEE